VLNIAPSCFSQNDPKLYSGRMARTPRPVGYDPRRYEPVAITVDMVVFTIRDKRLWVLLVQRGAKPFEGRWALPGGFVRPGETLSDAAARELREETSVEAASTLQQFGAYGDPDRDPRMRVVTIAFLAVVPVLGPVAAGTDARRAELHPVDEIIRPRSRVRFAFDHRQIFDDGLERARRELEATSLATAFVEKQFTLSDLRAVYEAVWGHDLDPGNFRRKVLSTPGFVVPVGKRAQPGAEGGKPPELYRAGGNALLDPPLRRPGRGPAA